MTCKIQNLTHRIVSIRGNSGETWHLPPHDSLDVMDVEVMENAKIAKLVANGVVVVQHDEGQLPVATTQEKGRRTKGHQE